MRTAGAAGQQLVSTSKPPRLRRDELRELMLSTGVQILQEEGLANGGGALTYADVFRQFEVETGVKISRAQVHGRIWDSVEEFRNDVLAHLSRYDAAWESDTLQGAALNVLETADLSSVSSRQDTLRELIRVVSGANKKFVNGNPQWELSSTIRSLQMVADFRGSADPTIIEALRDAELVAEDFYMGMYLDIADVVGAQLRAERSECTYMGAAGLLTKLLGALGGAATSRYSFFDGVPQVQINLGPDGAPQQWDFLSIGQLALVQYFFQVSEDGTSGERSSASSSANEQPQHADQANEIDPTQPIPRELLERRLIATGANLVRQNGLGHGAENLTYARVFDRLLADTGISVARAQVHGRIWDSQLDYQNDVLAQIVDVDITPSRASLEAQISDVAEHLDLTSAGSAFSNIETLAREFVSVEIMEMTTSVQWQLFCGVARTQSLRDDPPQAISGNIKDAYRRGTAMWTEFFDDLSSLLNVRVKPELGISRKQAALIFGQVFDELAEGVAKRETIIPGDLDVLMLPTGAKGEPERWSGLAIALLALTQFLFEPDV